MKVRALLALALVCAVAVPAASLASRSHTNREKSGRFFVWYAKPRNADERVLLSLIKASLLEKVMGELSKALVLPRTITIAVKGGQAGPYYNPDSHVIVFNFPFAASLSVAGLALTFAILSLLRVATRPLERFGPH